MTNLDNHYVDPRLAVIYDLDSGWSADREFYLALAGQSRQTILDLGCGTGLLCNAYAALGHDVTGVDPSAAMLAVARRKPHGDRIAWVESSAQDFSTQNLFSLVVMTGHAFQVLLEDEDILRTIALMGSCLSAGGRIVFESRNPNIDWSKEWDYEMEIETASGVVKESRRFESMANERMKFDLHYDFADETLVSKSELRFASMGFIARALSESGLNVENVLGDWDGSGFNRETSREMIFVASSAAMIE